MKKNSEIFLDFIGALLTFGIGFLIFVLLSWL